MNDQPAASWFRWWHGVLAAAVVAVFAVLGVLVLTDTGEGTSGTDRATSACREVIVAEYGATPAGASVSEYRSGTHASGDGVLRVEGTVGGGRDYWCDVKGDEVVNHWVDP